MKTFRYYIIIVINIIFYCSSCDNSKKISSLNDNIIIKKYFKKQERVQLKKLLSTFDTIILEKSQRSITLENAYSDFFNKLMNVKSASGHIPIDALDYSKFENQITSELFKKIWYYKKDYNSKREIIGKTIDINFEGVYIKFLEDISLDEEILKIYYNDILSSGSIAAPALVNNFIYNSKYLDTSKESIRLIIAIHYITLNNMYVENMQVKK